MAVPNTVMDHGDPCKHGISEEEVCCTELTQSNRPVLNICCHPAFKTNFTSLSCMSAKVRVSS